MRRIHGLIGFLAVGCFMLVGRDPAQALLDAATAILLFSVGLADWKTMEIPDRFQLALLGCGIASVFLFPEISMRERIIGLVCISVPMLFMCLVLKDAFGGGDLKLTAVMGFYLGWRACLVGVVIGFLIGGMQAVILLAKGRVKYGEGDHMALGPALCMGFFLAELYGLSIFKWYVHFYKFYY